MEASEATNFPIPVGRSASRIGVAVARLRALHAHRRHWSMVIKGAAASFPGSSQPSIKARSQCYLIAGGHRARCHRAAPAARFCGLLRISEEGPGRAASTALRRTRAADRKKRFRTGGFCENPRKKGKIINAPAGAAGANYENSAAFLRLQVAPHRPSQPRMWNRERKSPTTAISYASALGGCGGRFSAWGTQSLFLCVPRTHRRSESQDRFHGFLTNTALRRSRGAGPGLRLFPSPPFSIYLFPSLVGSRALAFATPGPRAAAIESWLISVRSGRAGACAPPSCRGPSQAS